MSDEDPLKTAKDSVALIGEVIKAAGDNPNVKAAANNLGQTALTITTTINNALLPLAAINFAFDKARAYFNGKFQEDLATKAAGIPLEQIVEPKASIAGPTLQGLAFTHEEASLRDMYLSLLATAMDKRVASSAHPAFVEIVKQLDAEDADLVRGALRSAAAIPIVQLHMKTTGEKGYHVVATHMLNLRGGPDSKLPIENSRLPALVDNWIRLGLVEVAYDKHLMDEVHYNWVDGRPETIRLRAQHENDKVKLSQQRGLMVRTRLGEQFARAVGLL